MANGNGRQEYRRTEDHFSMGSSEPRGFQGKGPKGYRRSDERIREDVCEALYRDPEVDASDIEVSVKDALVTLSGTVSDRESKRSAERLVENLFGVEDVRNDIRIAQIRKLS